MRRISRAGNAWQCFVFFFVIGLIDLALGIPFLLTISFARVALRREVDGTVVLRVDRRNLVKVEILHKPNSLRTVDTVGVTKVIKALGFIEVFFFLPYLVLGLLDDAGLALEL